MDIDNNMSSNLKDTMNYDNYNQIFIDNNMNYNLIFNYSIMGCNTNSDTNTKSIKKIT